MKSEMVLAVEDAALEGLGFGFRVSPKALTEILPRDALWFGPRAKLEHDGAFRQLIPYVVLRCGDQIASYYRPGAQQGDARLYGKRSVGFGGHINTEDAVMHRGSVDLLMTLDRATRRELQEEVAISGIVERRFLGYLRLRDSLVDTVHLGLVEEWELLTPSICSPMGEVVEPRFSPLAHLNAIWPEWETWSSVYLADRVAVP